MMSLPTGTKTNSSPGTKPQLLAPGTSCAVMMSTTPSAFNAAEVSSLVSLPVAHSDKTKYPLRAGARVSSQYRTSPVVNPFDDSCCVSARPGSSWNLSTPRLSGGVARVPISDASQALIPFAAWASWKNLKRYTSGKDLRYSSLPAGLSMVLYWESEMNSESNSVWRPSIALRRAEESSELPIMAASALVERLGPMAYAPTATRASVTFLVFGSTTARKAAFTKA
mmetsp:Transcript_24081/g.58537  ORF Transcript_24081/g.58537 Transcript_24081/m.58537 type:complete len:225 (+) Transcript_24081:2288-2962(+)